MKRKKGSFNPYLSSYLCLAMFCCIVISVLFLYISLENLKRRETVHNQEKITLVAEDLERQLEIFQKVSLQIRVNDIYRPFYFQRNKYYEYVLLNDFAKYQNYSPVVDRYFLYYSERESIFHSDATTINLDLFLESLAGEDAAEVKQLLNRASGISTYSLDDSLLFLFPLVISTVSSPPDAVLCVVMDKEVLGGRIQSVSGGLPGETAIYSGDRLLYSSAGPDFDRTHRDVLSVGREMFTVYYMQDHMRYSSFGILPLEILMVVAVVILMVFLASLLAWRSWRPIIRLSQKYRETLPADQGIHFASKLDEIDFMMESMLRDKAEVNALLEEKQEQLRRQLLLLLLAGKYSFDIGPYLTQAGLPFPGKYFFVVSVSFGQNIPEETLRKLCEMLGGLTDSQEGKYVYAITDGDQKIIHNLCNVTEKTQWDEVCIDIQELSESFEQIPAVGCGNVHESLNSLSASYLEALDNMESRQNPFEREAKVFEVPGENEILYRIRNCMFEGEEEAALGALEEYVAMLRKEGASVLMRQYLFMEFLGEMNKAFREYRMEMSKQAVSLIISAKEIGQFRESAAALIRNFCEQHCRRKDELIKNESYRIFQYVNEHFSDYDISIESVAERMNTNVPAVRNAIKEYADKNYKDYLIYLRMEYAKELLVKEKLTVAETCQKIGYGNISYFIKAFKEHTGVTPAYYKKMRG